MTLEIETVAVIGAGELGREFARATLVAGFRVVLEDVSETRLAEAVEWIVRENPNARLRLAIASTVEGAVREADLIVEAVAEEMEMKIEMFTIFDKFAKPDAIFASTSSLISVAELAAMTFCPERCIGMRFDFTSQKQSAIALTCTPETSEETIARCRDVGLRMGREIIVSRETDTRRPFKVQGKQDASVTNGAAEH
jgi:3-hydroxybutyryl-CoA dehydrogenase